MTTKWIFRSLLPLLFSSFAIVGVGARDARGNSSLALDGIGKNGSCHRAVCNAQLLSTSKGDDVILLLVLTRSNSTRLAVNDRNDLKFTNRLSYSSESRGGAIEEYYAIASSPLESDNITVVAEKCCYQILGMQTLAVSGADTSTVFDRDPSVPATVSCPSEDCGFCHADYNTNPGTCSTSIETSGVDFVFATTQINDAPGCGGYSSSPAGYEPPPGFTRVSQPNSWFEVDYRMTTHHSHVEFECNGTDAAAIVMDAITSNSSVG